MKSKFGSLLAMLLCGASFVTHAGPIPTYTNNYSGEYNCVLIGSYGCTQTATAWRLGYDIQDENQQAARWRFELIDAASPLQSIVYESGPYSHFILGTVFGVGATMYTSLTEQDEVLSFHSIGFHGDAAWIGDWSFPALHEMSYEEVAQFFTDADEGLSLYTLMQAVGQMENPSSLESFTVSGSRVYLTVEVPEPTVLALLGIGLAAFGVSRRRSRG